MPDGNRGGVETHWRVFGTGPVPALALHCSLAHGVAWSPLAQHVPDLTITAPDFLGHGKSADWDGRGDFHSVATRQAMDFLGQEPLHLIGHSFGATVALRLALEKPEAVASLTLFEPVLFCAARAAGSDTYAAYIAAQAPFDAALRAGRKEQAAEAFQAIWGRGEKWQDTPAVQRDYITARIGLIAAQDPALIADAAGLLSFGRLESLGIPVLLAEGAESPPVIDAINAELARRLPQVQRAVVAGAGHMLPLTHAADCAALVNRQLCAV